MSVIEGTDEAYRQALAGEGEHWGNFIAQYLLNKGLPGSVDMRLAFSQFRYDHAWGPVGLGMPGVNFRLREIRDLILGATARPGMRVLDLGCGAGWLSLELARRGAHVTAVDISPTNLAIGRHMAASNARNFPYLYQGFAGLTCRLEDFGSVDYQFGDLNAISLPTNEFDAVVVWDSLHHVRDVERLLEQVRGALKPTGRFFGVDHAIATPRTQAFNTLMVPWLDDFYAWVSNADPRWLYAATDRLARHFDLGILALDEDTTPLPGFAPFLDDLFAELLAIMRTGLRDEALQRAQAADDQPEVLSPFEDVSADRLTGLLQERFTPIAFRMTCPWIMPECHVPKYRSQPERIFQHYLSALLIKLGEHAISRGRADGQWFYFELTPTRPGSAARAATPGAPDAVRQLEAYRAHAEASERNALLENALAHKTAAIEQLTQALAETRRAYDTLAANSAAATARHRATVAQLGQAVDELRHDYQSAHDYAAYLEGELGRKNAALAQLEQTLRARETELAAVRRSRFGWLRGRRRR